MTSRNIFTAPIDTKAPPSMMGVERDHPAPRKGITSQSPLQTNKFYSNFFLDNQRAPTYTFPYSISWGAGQGVAASWGMVVSHIEASRRVFGPEKVPGAASYYFNPVGIQSLILSATELGNQTTVSTSDVTAFSAQVHLSKDGTSRPAISFPLVQGMPYITAEYGQTTPLIQTGVFFKTVKKSNPGPKPNLSKFAIELEDGSTWRLYAWGTSDLNLKVLNNGTAQATGPFTGVVQITKDPKTPGSEALLDDGAGIYPTTLELSGGASGRQGTYRFDFQREGHSMGNLYMYALPHHVHSFDNETMGRLQATQLQTTVKGLATLVKGSSWTMMEPNVPTDMDFAPWHPEKGTITTLSDRAKSLIRGAAAQELDQNMQSQTSLDSMYFSGKALAKFALVLYVTRDMLGDQVLFESRLGRLKQAFGEFGTNQQKFPLVYETAWGGVVSSATYKTGDMLADFGNTMFNDHHFHYGYHILAGAIIGYLDPSWLAENKDYINTLVRDVANPSREDRYFPMWRNFDWYHGHSWAHGLFASWDGKNQESSSEDVMHAYALKMWGKVTGNNDLEARGNLQLAILARSLRLYYLYQKDNKVQPKEFIGNKVAGILFENKVDHATFFSADIEAIQGIHMIPILAPTPYVRLPAFVREEWEAFFSGGRVDRIQNLWRSIIYANYATIEPRAAFDFFSSRDFRAQWLDGGASLTWFMAYSAALGGI
ncbi:putative endo-1,3(4)-beta-glucanase-like protein [Hapsidospora chrysogenum ATCC 11550]|uniref:glucan endo-1,3-beta-D-glucosidase n=1 Tax=Hapsidospora chrysogenum (strain ATCC 11550 / CBS 779.69 / DSM 880 / IAM 14645 / JCM 23072 / IMI 49137) TaxID=857340 RepID=A0A086T7W7_HAPC1|nr:putative endo-1,3(4)-beta-glucanase-like protein [Hapsidospora chrysogenum ATCC 11550]